MQSTPTELLASRPENFTLVKTKVEFPPFNQTVSTVVTNSSNPNSLLATNTNHGVTTATTTADLDAIRSNVIDTHLQVGDLRMNASVNQANDANQSSIKVVADLSRGHALLDTRMDTDDSVIRTVALFDAQNQSTRVHSQIGPVSANASAIVLNQERMNQTRLILSQEHDGTVEQQLTSQLQTQEQGQGEMFSSRTTVSKGGREQNAGNGASGVNGGTKVENITKSFSHHSAGLEAYSSVSLPHSVSTEGSTSSVTTIQKAPLFHVDQRVGFAPNGLASPQRNTPSRGGYIPRPSILEQFEEDTYPREQLPDTLYGVQNGLWLIVALFFVKIPIVRLVHGELPLDFSLLIWSFSGLEKTTLIYLTMCIGTLAPYLWLRMASKGWISAATCEILYRFSQCAHIVFTNRYIILSELSPVPSFFLTTQATVTFMKMHSYYVEVRNQLQACVASGESFEKYVKLRDFLYFWVAPTLVYRVDGYPKTASIRPKFLLRKVGAGIGLVMVIYILITEQFLPVLAQAQELTWIEVLVMLILPCSLIFFSLFFLVFEVMLNFAGELTKFADRHFYDSWWNATSMDEFSRKWNRPVHDWLLQYIYLGSMNAGLGKLFSQGATFLFSAILHELILAVTFRRPRAFLLLLMMVQIPLIRVFKDRVTNPHSRRFANLFFWLGMFVGPALLSVTYAREWYIAEKL